MNCSFTPCYDQWKLAQIGLEVIQTIYAACVSEQPADYIGSIFVITALWGRYLKGMF